jgi:hypothetical protein
VNFGRGARGAILFRATAYIVKIRRKISILIAFDPDEIHKVLSTKDRIRLNLRHVRFRFSLSIISEMKFYFHYTNGAILKSYSTVGWANSYSRGQIRG